MNSGLFLANRSPSLCSPLLTCKLAPAKYVAVSFLPSIKLKIFGRKFGYYVITNVERKIMSPIHLIEFRSWSVAQTLFGSWEKRAVHCHFAISDQVTPRSPPSDVTHCDHHIRCATIDHFFFFWSMCDSTDYLT